MLSRSAIQLGSDAGMVGPENLIVALAALGVTDCMIAGDRDLVRYRRNGCRRTWIPVAVYHQARIGLVNKGRIQQIR